MGTLWIEYVYYKLYWNSGMFTSTVLDSENVSSHTTHVRGISSTEDNDTMWISGYQAGSLENKAWLTSGRFTSTIKTSNVNYKNFSSRPQDISLDADGNVSWAEDGENGYNCNMWLMSGVFTTTVLDSLVTPNGTTGGCYDENGNTPVSAGELHGVSKLLLYSGEYTSTVITSMSVLSLEAGVRGVSWDGISDTLICGITNDKLYKLSGQFTSTVHDSLYVGVSAPQGIDTTEYDLRVGNIQSIVFATETISIAETVTLEKFYATHNVEEVDAVTINEVVTVELRGKCNVSDSIQVGETVDIHMPLLTTHVTEPVAVAETVYRHKVFIDGYEEGSTIYAIHSGVYEGQTFVASGNYRVTEIMFKLKRVGSPGTSAEAFLYNVDETGLPTGQPMCYVDFDPSIISTVEEWYIFQIPIYLELISAKPYAIVLAVNGGDENNYLGWVFNSDTPTYYTSGNGVRNDGFGWFAVYPVDESIDHCFATYGSNLDGYELLEGNDKECQLLRKWVGEQNWICQQITPTQNYTVYSLDLPLILDIVPPRQTARVFIVKLDSNGKPFQGDQVYTRPKKVLAEGSTPIYKAWPRVDDFTPWIHFDLDASCNLYAGNTYGIVVKLDPGADAYGPLYEASVRWVGSYDQNYSGNVLTKAATVKTWDTVEAYNLGFKLYGTVLDRMFGDAVKVSENVRVEVAGEVTADLFINVSDEISVVEGSEFHVGHAKLTAYSVLNTAAGEGDVSTYTQNYTAYVFPAPGNFWITAVTLKVARVGLPGTCYVGIRTCDSTTLLPTGEPSLTSGSFDGDTISTSPGLVHVVFTTPALLQAGQMYAISVSAPAADGVTNNLLYRYSNTSNINEGRGATTANWGASWTWLAGNDDVPFADIFGYAEKDYGYMGFNMPQGIDEHVVEITDTAIYGQKFTPSETCWLKAVSLPMYRSATVSGDFQIELYETSGGLPLYSGNQPGLGQEETIPVSSVGTVTANPMSWYTHKFAAPIYMEGGTTYCLIVNRPTTGTGSLYWGGCSVSPPYSNEVSSANGGTSWSTQARDRGHKIYIDAPASPLINIQVVDNISVVDNVVDAGRPEIVEAEKSSGLSTQEIIYGSNVVGLVLTPEFDYLCNAISVYAKRTSTPDDFVVKLYKTDHDLKPIGSEPFAQASQNTDDWLTTYDWHRLDFELPCVIYAGRQYVFEFAAPDGSALQYITLGVSEDIDDEAAIRKSSDGVVWTTYPNKCAYYKLHGRRQEVDTSNKMGALHESNVDAEAYLATSIPIEAQTFNVPTAFVCDRVAVALTSAGDTYGYIQVALYSCDAYGKPNVSGQTPLATGKLECGPLSLRTSRPLPWVYVELDTSVELRASVMYAIVVKRLPAGG